MKTELLVQLMEMRKGTKVEKETKKETRSAIKELVVNTLIDKSEITEIVCLRGLGV